jgi:cytochrome oxidase Cu insertion factor (SCO1/SenC/PrrC family)
MKAPTSQNAMTTCSSIRLAGACLAAALATAAGQAHAAPPTGPTSATSFFAPFQGLHLVDQDGQPFTTTKWAGHITLFSFIYTGCSAVCPVQTHALAQVQQSLPAAVRKQVRLVSVSIDPVNDTPATLKDYAHRMGADLSNWSFVTGHPKDIERLSSTLKLFKEPTLARRPEDHATWLWLVDDQGVVRQRYVGNPPDQPRLVREVTELVRLQRR